MEAACVAFAAAYFLHKDMFCMAIGTAESYGTLFNISKVASFAGVPGRDTAMLLPCRLAPLDYEGD